MRIPIGLREERQGTVRVRKWLLAGMNIYHATNSDTQVATGTQVHQAADRIAVEDISAQRSRVFYAFRLDNPAIGGLHRYCI